MPPDTMRPKHLCFTENDDALLAQGWPRQVRLVDGHPHDATAKKRALAWLGRHDATYFSDWPREVAHEVLRAISKPAPDVKTAVTRTVASFDARAMSQKIIDWVFIAETILGTDETLDAIADGFDGCKRASDTQAWVAATVGFLLLRASTRRKPKLVSRLAEQQTRFASSAKKTASWRAAADYLDVALGGAAAVKRLMSKRESFYWLEHAHDDPEYVRDRVAQNQKQGISVRLVEIAGLDVLKGLTKRSWAAAEYPSTIRDLGMVRAPEVVELALSLIGRPAAKDAPLRWLVSHADYARPIVDHAARRGDARAKAARSQMA